MVDNFAKFLQGARGTNTGSGHDDRTPSLSIGNGAKGVVLKCHAGCSTEAITAALGLKLADLFNGNGKPATKENFQKAAETIFRNAQGFGYNNFKIELGKRAVVRALRQAVVMENNNDTQIHRTSTEPR